MLTQQARVDTAHLQILAAAAQAYEAWHNEQVEVIHKRMLRRRINEDGQLQQAALVMSMPPTTMFNSFHDIDAELRRVQPSGHEDRKFLAEVRCWLRDSMSELVEFHLDEAVEHLERSAKRLEWLMHGRVRGGSRRYSLLDDASATRITTVMDRVDALLTEVVRVRALVAA